MSKATITSIPATPAPETSGDSAGSASPPSHLDSSEREARRYNPIEFLSWASSVIKYSEIRGELDDVAGIICCWQDHVLDAFHAELEAMKADDELHLYGLDKPETLIDIEQEILQGVATIVREDVHRKLLARKENQARRVTRANAAAAALAKEKRLRRRLVVVYLPDNQDEISACEESRAKKSKKSKKTKTTPRPDGFTSNYVPHTNAVGETLVHAIHTDDPKGEKEEKHRLGVHPDKIDLQPSGVVEEVKGHATEARGGNEHPTVTDLRVASIATGLIIESAPATLGEAERQAIQLSDQPQSHSSRSTPGNCEIC